MLLSVKAQDHSPLASQGKFSSPHKFSFLYIKGIVPLVYSIF